MRDGRWIVVLLCVPVVFLLVGSLAAGSPVGVGGAVIAAGGPVCWSLGDRARLRGLATGDRTLFVREFGWSVLAVLLLAAGCAALVLGSSRGW